MNNWQRSRMLKRPPSSTAPSSAFIEFRRDRKENYETKEAD
ncbi:MAG: hypothetical protein ABSD57_14520 [Verrucomicrobiota bacterium]